MKKLPLALGTSVLSLTLVLTGCTDASAPTDGATTSSEAPDSTATEADEMFVTMMIPHHEQAVEMSDIVLAKDDLDPQVAELAQQIKDAQGPEIDRMLGWLQDWGVEYDPDASGGMDHGSMGDSMDGMMSEEDMTALEEADGATAGRLFLEQMIMHHEGAVDMAETALEDAQNPDVLELAQQVIDDQTAEIATMKDLLTQI
ncbi:DUF305 domain-containing protein [Microbacterium murale]|uniref:DUF305 domain-containing protein n=1 Tax=Microbacterium murale TaxID=1081040 RepID=A0ABQ1RNV2_9MICO|nr:DUF305 domain-containing protein [Microbacterium murale]GGD76215.1 DUF305 domain-containing protein [Microbacterium murale]